MHSSKQNGSGARAGLILAVVFAWLCLEFQIQARAQGTGGGVGSLPPAAAARRVEATGVKVAPPTQP